MLTMTLGGCKDDFYDRNPYCPEGEPAVVSIALNAPEREQFTRSELQPEQDNRINSLWLGIFNANTGEVSTNLVLNNGDHGFTAGAKENHTDFTLTGIPTVSGESRIVAVANPEGHTGCTIDNKTSGQDLLGLLKNVETWDDYLKICVGLENSADNANVQTPQVSQSYALVMSGSFVPTGYDGHDTNQTWSNDLLNQTVNIYPDNNKLDGKVHLRRLLSHIVFNIQPGGSIVDIEPVSWQVYNAPVYSWMHERTDYGNFGDDAATNLQTTNAGDALTPAYADNQNYKPSLIYTSTDFTKGTITTGEASGRNSYKFDFWMYENKRQGLESCDNYQKRDLEYGKNTTNGSLMDPDATGSGSYDMSGVFMSLTSNQPVTLNNKATYVDIPCVVTYLKETDGTTNGSTAVNPPNADDIATGATRVANVTYRIHLGYTNPNPQATDFNSYRNSSYTYNVTVQSVNNVLVEAFRKGDDQPGGFGTVTDVTDQYYELDAHYNAFNIRLTQNELRTFSFSIQAYESGVLHEFYGGLTEKTNKIPTPDNTDNYKYYSWIEILPTTGENVLQAYPRDKSTLLHLGDLLPKDDGTPSQTSEWYTVFVNEYTYEESNDETGGNWKKYVKQPNRNVWINVTEHVSADQASSYYKAKYAFSQKSIQTYYDPTSDAANALGLEHVDENLGMNIRWTGLDNWSVSNNVNETTVDRSHLDNENGRWNAGIFANYINNLWSGAVSFTTPQTINSADNSSQQISTYYPYLTQSNRVMTVPKVNTFNDDLYASTNVNARVYNVIANSYDPQTNNSSAPQYYQAYLACMNRNRDLDGDGTIDPEEIRWFLPTSGQMLRMILGRNALSNPIMSYPDRDLPALAGGGFNVLFHYMTSDYKIIWSEEGMSSSEFNFNGIPENGNAIYARAPWQVRCVRNLGVNLGGAIQRGNRVTVAYQSDVNATTKGGVVRPIRYRDNSLRNPIEGPLAIHKTNDPKNRMALYGFEIAPRGNEFGQSGTNAYLSEQRITKSYYTGNENQATDEQYKAYVSDVNDEFCQELNTSTGRTGWRVPNQKEIVIMLRTTYTNAEGKTERILDTSLGASNAYYCVTQEYWSNTSPAVPSLDPGYLYRFCTVAQALAQAKNLGRMSMLRCVRDLTAAEANMIYDDIVKPKTKPAKKVVRKVVRKKKVRR